MQKNGYSMLIRKKWRTPLQIINGQLVSKGVIIKGASVIVEDGKIKYVGKAKALRNIETIDAKGLFVSPGFIDSHIHGDPAKVLSHEIKYGTTAIVSAISCGSPEKISGAVKTIKHFIESSPLGAAVLGVRIEGPYISKARAGAQDKKFIRPPSADGLRRIIKICGGLLKMVTIAPELRGSRKLIKILEDNGITASMGHTDADRAEGLRAIDAGITHATHLFNGMRRITEEDGGAAAACLKDKRVVAELIFDLIHVRPALLMLALDMKGGDLILITDSVRAEVRGSRTSGGVYRLRDGTIAGSNLTMIEAVKNAVTYCGVNLTDAVRFATLNPAKLLGVSAFKGSIARGKDADIVMFDKNFNVKMTIMRGKIVYQK